jgi:hydrogenase nickel incorporation protein HypA/HybF
MHEYSIVQALLERVDQEMAAHDGTRVHRVRVSIGELAGVEIGLLRTAFETIRHRTCCEQAELDVRHVDARWECPACGTVIPRGTKLRCGVCDVPARLLAGDEIMLEQIELEAP